MGRRPFVRERILEAAFDLVAREGWEAVTSRQIASAADVGPASMYKHFPSMEDLGRELYAVALAPLAEELEGLLGADLTPRRLLPKLCELVYAWYDTRPRALALLVFPPHAFTPIELAADNNNSIRNRAVQALELDEDRAAVLWGGLVGPLHDRYLRRRSGTMAPLAPVVAAALATVLPR